MAGPSVHAHTAVAPDMAPASVAVTSAAGIFGVPALVGPAAALGGCHRRLAGRLPVIWPVPTALPLVASPGTEVAPDFVAQFAGGSIVVHLVAVVAALLPVCCCCQGAPAGAGSTSLAPISCAAHRHGLSVGRLTI